MFSGIIQTKGKILKKSIYEKELSLEITAPVPFLSGVSIGDSIAVSGACLTVVWVSQSSFGVDLSEETLAKTYFSDLENQSEVNLEKALTLNTLINGHLVSGHVDGVAEIINRQPSGRSVFFQLTVPVNLVRYLVLKGSVCLDGVSLTINGVENNKIEVLCVPQTLKETTLNAWNVGKKVHIEVDLMARYCEKLSAADLNPK